MILIKRAHQHSDYDMEVEVLERKEVEEILDSLHDYDLIATAVEEAWDYVGMDGSVTARLDVRDGNIDYVYNASNHYQLEPNVFVNLGTITTRELVHDIDDEWLLDAEELELLEVIANEEGCYRCEACEKVIEHFKIDTYARQKEYVLDSTTMFDTEYDVKQQLDEIYLEE